MTPKLTICLIAWLMLILIVGAVAGTPGFVAINVVLIIIAAVGPSRWLLGY